MAKPQPVGEQYSLLYVEDDIIGCEIVSRMIGCGFPELTVYQAHDGKSGLELFRKHQPDIVLTDISMPIMNGLEMAKEIRNINADTKIIVTTAHDDTRFFLDCIDIGIRHYLIKPIAKDKLYAAVGKSLENIKLQKQVQEQNLFIRKLHCAVENSPCAIIITDLAGNIEYANPRLTINSGYSLKELLGSNIRMLESGELTTDHYEIMWKTIASGKEWRGEFHNRRKNGELYWESASISPILNSEGEITHFVSVHEDITERRAAADKIAQMAYYDQLTGLPNRLLFNERLGRALAYASRRSRLLALLFLDLDRFKVVNDTLGHAVGDLLLQAVSQRLRECCQREEDTVARRGGDEFIILLQELESPEDAAKLASKIITAFARSFDISHHELCITPSIGISIYPENGQDLETLVKNADMAMYRAKEQGRNNFQFYTPSIGARNLERLAMENQLRRAIELDELQLHYQPKMNMESGEIVGVEALLRWNSPEFGMIMPEQFIHLAEETGLIFPIGKWVLHEACAQNKAWQDAGFPPMHVSVNVSLRQFQHSSMVDIVKEVLATTGLDPRWLVLELTESVMIQDVEETATTLHILNKLGISISLDDFGTGYSALNYLKKIPIHTLKIDQSFVQDIMTNNEDAAIARAVIAMAHSLNLNVIAEGVESREQLDFLRTLKCNEAQGFFFSRPLPAAEVPQMLQKVRECDEKPV